MNSGGVGLHLRVIQINDVYELDHLPSFATLVKQHKNHRVLDAKANSCDDNDKPDKTITVLAGDFLGPSLLSSLDRGAGMVDVLQECGVTHVCFGNHECDVPFPALQKRIIESSKPTGPSASKDRTPLIWINSNMQDLNRIADLETPEVDIVAVSSSSPAASNVRLRVGLLGLLTDDSALYREDAFGSARIDNVSETTQKLLNKYDPSQVDFWIPLTHQSMEEDRLFAAHSFTNNDGKEKVESAAGDHPLFPIIIGGHDHTKFDEIVPVGTSNSSTIARDSLDSRCRARRILKTGYDAQTAAIIDFYWEVDLETQQIRNPSQPKIEVEFRDTSDFEPDPVVAQRVRDHLKLIEELEKAKLFAIHKWRPKSFLPARRGSIYALDGSPPTFSTKGNRLGYNYASTTLVTMIRLGLHCEVGLVNAGTIRGNTDYEGQEFFSWSDLKAELPFSTPMVALPIPGRVLESCMRYSRQPSRQDPPIADGGFLHGSINMDYNDETQTLERIRGKPMEPDRCYMTAFSLQLIQGLDNLEPLLEWWKSKFSSKEESQGALEKLEDSAIPIKYVVVELCCALLWLQLGSFDEIDINHDGKITRDEIVSAAANHFGKDSCVADLVVDNIMAIADMHDENNSISPLEMMTVQLLATDFLTTGPIDEEDFDSILRQTAGKVLNKTGSMSSKDGGMVFEDQIEQMVQRIKKIIYLDTDTGTLKRRNALEDETDNVDPSGSSEHNPRPTLGQLRRRSLLL